MITTIFPQNNKHTIVSRTPQQNKAWKMFATEDNLFDKIIPSSQKLNMLAETSREPLNIFVCLCHKFTKKI